MRYDIFFEKGEKNRRAKAAIKPPLTPHHRRALLRAGNSLTKKAINTLSSPGVQSSDAYRHTGTSEPRVLDAIRLTAALQLLPEVEVTLHLNQKTPPVESFIWSPGDPYDFIND